VNTLRKGEDDDDDDDDICNIFLVAKKTAFFRQKLDCMATWAGGQQANIWAH
jgi:hypothetical protein